MQVVTEKLELPPLSLQNTEGIRLMTVDIGTTTIAMQLYDADGKVVDSFPSFLEKRCTPFSMRSRTFFCISAAFPGSLAASIRESTSAP